uniref:Ig-like domain-containing protein n=1 Tax=Mola mola TaxID=94237 RepID=A0A3Q3VZS2_MOLML
SLQRWQPPNRMGPLLLLTFKSNCYFINPIAFTIRNITLSIEPKADVNRGTNVTLRCQAVVSSLGDEMLSREYTICKDSSTVYTKTSSSSDDLLYPLPDARVSNAGKYKCAVSIGSKQMTSQTKKLTVKGLSKPVLQLNNNVVEEGEKLIARCMAPGETGSFFFYFYDDANDIMETKVSSNHAEAELHFRTTGNHRIHCAYVVFITPDSIRSEDSNDVIVSVKELPIMSVMEIAPQYRIYEGDRLSITCTISNYLHSSQSIQLYLSQGTRLLSHGDTRVNHSMEALAKDPGEFECKLEVGNVVKVAKKTISVTELFSAPTLTMSPANVFQREQMILICKSKSYASERLGEDELTYSLEEPQHFLSPKNNGVFYGKALLYEFNFTCAAKAKGITKHSQALTVRPKVYVSVPKISVLGRAVLGQPVKIVCQSDKGSLPINYTLVKNYDTVNSVSVRMPSQQALFTVTITSTDELNRYMCGANNRPGSQDFPFSRRLNTTVIEPLSNPALTVIPNVGEISEGDHLYLICGVKGTPPVTFKWYRSDRTQSLYATTSYNNNTSYEIPLLSKGHSGKYHCEAVNHANNVVRSDLVTIEVRMALWKKAVIVGFCLLTVSVTVLVCVLCFRSKRGRETYSPPASQASFVCV